MKFLKQSTAATVPLGPFVDAADAATPETALTIAQADIRLRKAGGAAAQTSNVAGATHGEAGYYDVPLDATDTGTVGRLRVSVAAAGALPVWEDFFVLPAAIFDWLTGGAAPLAPTVAGRTLDVTATGAAGIDWANVEGASTTVDLSGTSISTGQAIGSVTGAVGSVTGNVGGNVAGSVGSVTGAVGSVAAAVTLPAIPADWITAAGIAPDAVTELQAGLATQADVGAVGAYLASKAATAPGFGSWGTYDPATDSLEAADEAGVAHDAGITADIAAVKADTAAILLDTGTDGVVVAAGSKTGYSLSGTQTFNVTGNITGDLSGSVGSVTAPVTAGTVSDKTGYKLASDGLDSISTTAPSGVASNFREMVVMVYRRFFKRVTKSSTAIKTYADDNTTEMTSQTISASGTDEIQGHATAP